MAASLHRCHVAANQIEFQVMRLLPASSTLLIGLWQLVLVLCSPLAYAQSAGSGDQISKGEYLARAGDCIACHTVPGGNLFAGGRAMPTPFGTLYSSNITPDTDDRHRQMVGR